MSSQKPMAMPKPLLNFDDENNKSSPKESNQTPRSQAKRQMPKPLLNFDDENINKRNSMPPAYNLMTKPLVNLNEDNRKKNTRRKCYSSS